MVGILSVFLALLAAPVVLQATCKKLARPVVPELGLSYRRIVQQNPILPEGEQQALLEQFAKTADLSLRNKLVVHNLPLIFSLVRKHIGPYREHFFDLVHEGVIGLIEAITDYDPFSIQNTSFGSFATTVIKHHLFRYLRENVRVVRVKRRYDQQKKFESLKKSLERQNLNAHERREKLAQKMRASPQMIDLMDTGYSEVTLDSIAHLLKGDEASFMVKDSIFLKGLQRFLQTCSPRERDIFKKRFLSFNPPSQRQLAKEYGTLQESIYGTEKNLIKKLKKFMADFIPRPKPHKKVTPLPVCREFRERPERN